MTTLARKTKKTNNLTSAGIPLRRFRHLAGLTIDAVSLQTAIDIATLSRAERNLTQLDPERLAAIEGVLRRAIQANSRDVNEILSVGVPDQDGGKTSKETKTASVG